ncbi:MAG TPA: DNA polymerase III subunit gamma/tau [Gammaproteobacteria bacterium]|nr:DNA polymerase III subunit gamma/tau [Gammaproteobacteria bacterium]
MSYTVLAVKWRPRRFGDLVGQQHVVKALMNSLKAERLHHAYLFSGTRGVGKTTVARILAKALNCEQGIVAEPCGVCDACQAIDQGRFVDLLEVDAASRTKVDDTRELLDNVQYAPSRGRYKVYLIDEVHMLSNHSFNALLKTLEEPPPHVKFLLATTDPQKLPVTVLSRCLQFNLKRLSLAQIQAQLEKICAAEDVAAEAEGLKALAKAADGSLRDALSMLDQAIAFSGGGVKAELVNSMLGTIDRGHVLRMLEALAAGDGPALLDEVARLEELAPDYGSVLEELMGLLQRLAVIQLVGDRAPEEELAVLEPLAERISAEDVQLYYQIALQGRRDLPVSRDQRMSTEMTLLRMLAFRPEAEAAAPPRQRAGGVVRETQRRKAEISPERPSSPQSPDDGPAPIGPEYASQAPDDRMPDRSGHRTPSAAAPKERGSSEEGPERIEDWAGLVQAAELRGAARQLAEHCELASITEKRIELVLAADKETLNTQQLRERLQAAISLHFGRAVTVNISPGQPSRPTPAERRRANEDERMRRAREAMEQDPNVRAVQEAFGAVLEPDSIRPMD